MIDDPHESLTLSAARALYPAVADGTYLDTANFTLVARPVAETVRATAEKLTGLPESDASARYLGLEHLGQHARREIARLVGADASEIALVESTSHGLQISSEAIPLESGDEVIYASWDFLGVPVTWQRRAASAGLRLRSVPLAGSPDPTETLIAAFSRATRVVCTTSVTEAIGVRLNLPRLAAACRAANLWLVVDVMQEAGVRQLDLRASGVDMAAAGGHKWLGCPFGAGFLYVRNERQDTLRPPHAGYLGLQDPPGGWDAYLRTPTPAPVETLQRWHEARALEIGGTPNFLGRAALAQSCALLNRVGIEKIERHVLALTGQLMARLVQLDLRVLTPRDEQARAGIVCFTLDDAAREADVVHALLARRVYVSQRYNAGLGGIRVSVHLYNGERDVEALVRALEEVLAAAD